MIPPILGYLFSISMNVKGEGVVVPEVLNVFKLIDTWTEEPPVAVSELYIPTDFSRTATPVTTTTIEYTWTAPETRGTADGYRIINDSTGLQDGVDIPWGTTTGNATNLTANTTYTHKVITYDSEAVSTASNTAGDTTAVISDTNLYQVQDFLLSSFSSTSANFTYTVPTVGGALGKRIYNGLVLLKEFGTDNAAVGETATVQVGGLASSTLYSDVYIVTYKTGEESPKSTPAISFTTLAPAAFQLAEGHFVSKSITLMPTGFAVPRGTAETNAASYVNNAYPGDHWQIGIGVYGVAWPCKYELSTTAVGLSLGEFLATSGDLLVPDDAYGVLSGTVVTPGVYPITVTVTDQDGDVLTMSWNLTVGTSGWLFVSPAGNDANPGTKALPKQTWWDGIYISDTDTTNANKRVVFMAGTYSLLDADTGLRKQHRIETDKKPVSYTAYHNGTAYDEVIFDTSTGNFSTGGGMLDLFVAGIIFDGTRTNAKNMMVWRLAGNGLREKRIAFFMNTFRNITHNAYEWIATNTVLAGDWVLGDVTDAASLSYQARIDHVSGAVDGTLNGDFIAGNLILSDQKPVANGGIVTDWLTSTVYAGGDQVRNGTLQDYQCIVPHTSDVFATDLAAGKWVEAPNGVIGGDNPSCIIAYDRTEANPREHLSYIRNVMETTCTYQLISGYDVKESIMELNVAENIDFSGNNHSAIFLFTKGPHYTVTVRANTAVNMTAPSSAIYLLLGEISTGLPCTDTEMCWNTLTITGNNVTARGVYGGDRDGPIENNNIFRNTISISPGSCMQFIPTSVDSELRKLKGNALYGLNGYIFDNEPLEYVDLGNAYLSVGDIDANGALTDDTVNLAKTTYEGTMGYGVK